VVADVQRRVPRSALIVWLVGDQRAPHAWQGVRQLLARAVDRTDPRVLDDVFARHRPILSILYPDSTLELAADDHDAAAALRGDWRSHDTHGTASWQPIVRAAAELVVAVVAATGAIVVVPELADLDAQTGHALVEAAREHGTVRIAIHVGHDPAREPVGELVWGVPPGWQLEHVRAQLCDYQLSPGCQTSWLTGADDATPSGIPPDPVNPWSRPAPDAVALELLAGAGQPSSDQLAACVAAMRWCIEAYAFGSAFRIGARLEPYAAGLNSGARAEHAALTAIAATNVHFVDTTTPGFDDRLYAMYERAIALAIEPTAAAVLAVRLALAAVERGGRAAEIYLRDASSRLEHVDSELERAYHLAWLAIARALDCLHRADLSSAETFARDACAGLERAAALAPAQRSPVVAARLRGELACARFSLFAHAAIHASRLRDPSALAWLARADAERPAIPAVLLFDALHWTLLEALEHDRDVIYAHCCAGIADAERHWNSSSWYLYRAIAADCAYRMGRLADAVEHVGRLVTASRFGNRGTSLVGDVRPFAIRVFLRAGMYEALTRTASSVLDDPGAAGRADVHGLVALAHAARGDREAQDQALDRAIEDAVADGEQAVMLRIAVTATQALTISDRHDEAKVALDNAWELAADQRGDASSVVLAPDILRLCLLQARLLGATEELLARALSRMPGCMGDSESWWDATELLDLLISWLRDGHRAPVAAEPALAMMRAQAGTREDWKLRFTVLDALSIRPAG
jgi:hypothetical protein